MIQSERLHFWQTEPNATGDYILYWMQASQRVMNNHALAYAIEIANQQQKPLWVVFVITETYPGANARHYQFMFDGLKSVAEQLRQRNIRFSVLKGNPSKTVQQFLHKAHTLVMDTGYTHVQRQWRIDVATDAECSVVQVESDVVIPVRTAYQKEAFGAQFIRKKIHQRWAEFLVPCPTPDNTSPYFDEAMKAEIELNDLSVKKFLKIDHSVDSIESIVGGESVALELLDHFCEEKLIGYDEFRNHPGLDYQSGLSPYLHFGQISPLTMALAVMAYPDHCDSFLEELIVRRELAMNMAYYNPAYDSLDCLPDWAKGTLSEHRYDDRTVVYPLDIFEAAKTHDEYWNAAQSELLQTGSMHGYMRMYWGKKIIEWTASPEDAFRIMVYLNDTYALDGRDPNGYAGILWCFGKHDRAWTERPVFGKVRYMNENGLKRKFDMKPYVDRYG